MIPLRFQHLPLETEYQVCLYHVSLFLLVHTQKGNGIGSARENPIQNKGESVTE